jgi:hypothetical protein
MATCFDFLFYCFYCLATKRKPGRVGAAKFGLWLFVLLLPVGYALLAAATGSQWFSFRVATGAELLLQAWLWLGYFRSAHFHLMLTQLPSDEPYRVRYALLGAGLLALSYPLPTFLFLVGAVKIKG